MDFIGPRTHAIRTIPVEMFQEVNSGKNSFIEQFHLLSFGVCARHGPCPNIEVFVNVNGPVQYCSLSFGHLMLSLAS